MQKTTTTQHITNLVDNIMVSLSQPDAGRPPHCYLNMENPPVLPMENIGVMMKDVPIEILSKLPDLVPYINIFNREITKGDVVLEPFKLCFIEKDQQYVLIIEFTLDKYGFFEKIFSINNLEARKLLEFFVDNSIPLYENETLIYDTPDPKPERTIPFDTANFILYPRSHI